MEHARDGCLVSRSGGRFRVFRPPPCLPADFRSCCGSFRNNGPYFSGCFSASSCSPVFRRLLRWPKKDKEREDERDRGTEDGYTAPGDAGRGRSRTKPTPAVFPQPRLFAALTFADLLGLCESSLIRRWMSFVKFRKIFYMQINIALLRSPSLFPDLIKSV